MNRVLAAAAIAAFSIATSACASSGGSGYASGSTADTAKTDAGGGGEGVTADTATANDTASSADSTAGTDGSAAGDADKDSTAADVKKDTAAPPPTWGNCTGPSDAACLQSCATVGCSAEIQGCLGDSKCKAAYDCISGCQKTPPVMPPQDATPVEKLKGESDGAYCTRVCFLKAGNLTAAKLFNFNSCIFGKCLDCAKASPEIKDVCKAQCGAYAKCEKEQAACNGDNDCLEVAGCVGQCNDNACAAACAGSAKPGGVSLFSKLTECVQANKDLCVAP